MKLYPNNITLDRVKNSNYWNLIGIIVWNHYSEQRYQDESMITIEENWYGKMEGGSSHSKNWDNPDYTEPGFIRTLGSIDIELKRDDYRTIISISVESGNIQTYGMYTDKDKKCQPNFNIRPADICNWMFDNDLLIVD